MYASFFLLLIFFFSQKESWYKHQYANKVYKQSYLYSAQNLQTMILCAAVVAAAMVYQLRSLTSHCITRHIISQELTVILTQELGVESFTFHSNLTFNVEVLFIVNVHKLNFAPLHVRWPQRRGVVYRSRVPVH